MDTVYEDLLFESDLFSKAVAPFNDNSNGYIVESVIGDKLASIGKFYKELLDTINEQETKFLDAVVRNTENEVDIKNKDKYDTEIDELIDKLTKMYNNHIRMVEVINNSTIEREFLNMYRSLITFSRFLSNKNGYKSRENVFKDLDEFKAMRKKFEDDLDDLKELNVMMNVKTAVSILDSSRDRRKPIRDAYDDISDMLNDLSKRAKDLASMKDKVTAEQYEILDAQIFALNQISVNIIKFSRKNLKYLLNHTVIELV